MRIFLIEPYYTGSHQAWADGWQEISQHEIHLLTMEGRFWKWRMHGGPVTLAHQATQLAGEVGLPDVIVASSMLDLATFLGLAGPQLGNPPSLLYMHENQLTYPLSPRTRGEDLSYGFINWRSMLAAAHIVFNSHYHRDAFFEAINPFLKNFPDYRQTDLVAQVRDKTSVVGVGLRMRSARKSDHESPLVLWNQRWEYDKNPVEMFEILYRLADQGVAFRLAVTGENFRQVPTEFADAEQRLDDHIVQFGFAEQDRYDELVANADVVLSAAQHEFFGVSVAEAVAAGAFPVLPDRLSYPELIPSRAHAATLYETPEQAVELLAKALADPAYRTGITPITSAAMEQFSWTVIGPRYDEIIEGLR